MFLRDCLCFQEDFGAEEGAPAAPIAAADEVAAAAPAAPVAVRLTVPADKAPGSSMEVTLENGHVIALEIPEGLGPGDEFEAQIEDLAEGEAEPPADAVAEPHEAEPAAPAPAAAERKARKGKGGGGGCCGAKPKRSD